MEILLAVATLLGGDAAAWYFWDKYREIKSPEAKASGIATVRAQKRGPAKSVVVRAQTRAFCVLMGEDEGATRSALHTSRDVVVSALKKSRAQLVDTPADTVIAEFANAEDGVAAVVAARDALLAANKNAAPANRVHYRFGIDQGKVEKSSDGPTGPAVEGAAALDCGPIPTASSLARPCECNFRATVRSQHRPSRVKNRRAATNRDTRLAVAEQAVDCALPFKVIIDGGSEGAALADGLRIDTSGVFLLGAGSANGAPHFDILPVILVLPGGRPCLAGSGSMAALPRWVQPIEATPSNHLARWGGVRWQQ